MKKFLNPSTPVGFITLFMVAVIAYDLFVKDAAMKALKK